MKSDARHFFTPYQFGVARKAGTERVIHTLRTLYNKHIDAEDFVILKVDLRNAFNKVSRAELLRRLPDTFPMLTNWARWCYSTDSNLWYQQWKLSSKEGVQQGDPLGPLFFAVVIQSIIVTIAEETPGLEANLWYLDDGTIAGRTSDVYRAYEIIEEMGPQRGLQLRHMKCELIRHRPQPLVEKSPVYPFPKTFKRIYTEKTGGWEILGTPIGSKAFCEKFIEDCCISRLKEGIGILTGI